MPLATLREISEVGGGGVAFGVSQGMANDGNGPTNDQTADDSGARRSVSVAEEAKTPRISVDGFQV
jgi:hypothetical protein